MQQQFPHVGEITITLNDMLAVLYLPSLNILFVYEVKFHIIIKLVARVVQIVYCSPHMKTYNLAYLVEYTIFLLIKV